MENVALSGLRKKSKESVALGLSDGATLFLFCTFLYSYTHIMG